MSLGREGAEGGAEFPPPQQVGGAWEEVGAEGRAEGPQGMSGAWEGGAGGGAEGPAGGSSLGRGGAGGASSGWEEPGCSVGEGAG